MIHGRPKWGNRQGRIIPALTAALLLCGSGVRPGYAYRNEMGPGDFFVAGEGNLFYHEASGMLSGLGVIAVKYLVIPLLDDEEEEDYYFGDCDCYPHDPHCVDPDVPVEGAQFGGSAGLFVASGISLGMRFLAQQNDPEDFVDSFWGGGPEITFYGERRWNATRPFMSVAALYTKGRIGEPYDDLFTAGPSFLLRTGLSTTGPGGGFYVHTSYQTTPLNEFRNFPHTRDRWGIGMGIILLID